MKGKDLSRVRASRAVVSELEAKNIKHTKRKIMKYILFCYDITEKDLARDIKDFLCEVGIENIKMIPLEADRGLTLQDKDRKYIDSAYGIIFLLTPGAERFEKYFPSPSVADEMGQAKQKFRKVPERITYLKDRNCHIQAVDQRSYIPFDRNNIRSVIGCLTLLVRNLRESGLLERKETEPKETPGINIPELAESLEWRLKEICFDLSGQPDGAMENRGFDQHLKNIYSMNERDINFVKSDLQQKGLIIKSQPPNDNWWVLTNVGWEIARFESEKKEKLRGAPVSALIKALAEATVKDSFKK